MSASELFNCKLPRVRSKKISILLVLLSLILVGCGASDEPIASITFPPHSSFTTAASVIATGTSNVDSVKSLRVNGVNATSNDGFAHWQAIVPLSSGINTLNVETFDESGNSVENTAQSKIEKRLFFSELNGVFVDSANDRILVVDQGLDALISVDNNTGKALFITDKNSLDPQQEINLYTDIVVDVSRNHAFILATNGPIVDVTTSVARILSVDLGDGSIEVLSSSIFPNSVSSLVDPTAMVVDSDKNRILVIDKFLKAVIAVDIESGERTVLSGPGTPDGGVQFQLPTTIAIDHENQRLFIVDVGLGSIISVNLVSGERSLFLRNQILAIGEERLLGKAFTFELENDRVLLTSSDTLMELSLITGSVTNMSTAMTGLSIANSSNIALDRDRNRVVVTSLAIPSIVAIDLSNGKRISLSSNSSYVGNSTFTSIEDAVFDSTNDSILFIDSESDGDHRIMSLDINSGERSTITVLQDLISLQGVQQIVVDSSNNIALIADRITNRVIAINLASGAQNIFSVIEGGETSALLLNPQDSVFDQENNRILTLGEFNNVRRIVAIDLNTGLTSLFAESSFLGNGFNFSNSTNLVLDSTGNRVLLLDKTPTNDSVIIAIDLRTGVGGRLFDEQVGVGEFPLPSPAGIAIDTDTNQLFVLESSNSVVIAIDLVSGERRVFSDAVDDAPFDQATGLVFDDNTKRLFITTKSEIIAIESELGQRAQIAFFIPPNPTAPIAHAGSNQTVIETGTVILDGSISDDPQNLPLTFEWLQVNGTQVALSDSSIARPQFDAPNLENSEIITFQLIVDNGASNSLPRTVQVLVEASNDIPVAVIESSVEVTENSIFILDGTASSDPEAKSLSFSWSQLSGTPVSISNPLIAQPQIDIPDLIGSETLSFQLIVSDGKLESEAVTVSILVVADNGLPIADAGPDQVVTEVNTVTLTAFGSTDPENQDLSFSWLQVGGVPVVLSNNSSSQTTFTVPNLLQNDVLVFQLIVSDGVSSSEADFISISVLAENEIPIANAGIDQILQEDELVILNGVESNDPENLLLSFFWEQVAGIPIILSDPLVASPQFIAPNLTNTDTLVFQLIVNDGVIDSDIDRVNITIIAFDELPTADAGPDQDVTEEMRVTLDGTGSTDPENQNLTFLWIQTSGIMVTLSDDTEALPTFTAPNLESDTSLTFTLEVSDGTDRGSIGEPDSVTITIHADNEQPIADSGPSQEVDENELVTLDGSESIDPEGRTLTFAWVQVSGPSVELRNSTRFNPNFVSPNLTEMTTLTFQLIVNDGVISSVPKEVSIIVDAENETPTANAGDDQTIEGEVIVTLEGTSSTDPENQNLTFSWSQISGTPVTLRGSESVQAEFDIPELLEIESLTFQLVVNDGDLNSAPDTVKITIIPPNDIPLADAGFDQFVNEKDFVVLDGTASSDPENQTLLFTWTQLAGPSVSLANSNTAQPRFDAPNLPSSATVEFQLIVNDGVHNSIADIVKVSINAENETPIASAGEDQLIPEGVLVRLDGSQSFDPEIQTLSFVWTQISGPTVFLSGSTTNRPNFIAPNLLSPETLVFQLIVNDGLISSLGDIVQILIEADNDLPIADVGEDVQVIANATVNLDGSASSDPENQGLSFLWQQVSGEDVLLFNTSSETLSFIAPEVIFSTRLVFQLVVNDGINESFADSIEVLVAKDTHEVVIDRELMITDLSVVESEHTESGGHWTFEHLITQMMPQEFPTEIEKSEFVLNWLNHWMSSQIINGFNVFSRSGIQGFLIDPWLRASGDTGILDLSLAPFRLLAIVNRIDLAQRSDNGKVLNAGEGRFVFGVLDQFGGARSFTVIFEYGLPADTEEELQAWVDDWHDLSLEQFSDFEDDYNNALVTLTDRFSGKNANPLKPNGSALNQLRTNEIDLGFPWELREFKISSEGNITQVTVANNPDLSLRFTSILSDFINENTAELLTGNFTLPDTFQGQPFLAGSSLNDGGFSSVLNPSGVVSNEARHQISLNTCMGCHGRETNTSFLHIEPRSLGREASLSGFLRGTTVSDPIDSTRRNFSDLNRRKENLVCLVIRCNVGDVLIDIFDDTSTGDFDDILIDDTLISEERLELFF